MNALLFVLLVAAEQPVPVETMLGAVENALQRNKPDRARLMLDEATKAYPNDGRVDLLYGLADAQQEKNETALGHFKDAVQKSPELRMAHLQLAMLYDVLGRYEQSNAVYHAATARFPKDGELFAEWGTTLILRKRFKEAAVVLKKALALQPKDATVIADLAFVELKLGKAKEAVKGFELAFKLGASEPQLRRQYGDALAAAGDLAGAEKLYTELMQKDSAEVDLWYRRSKVRQARGDNKGAAEDKAAWEQKRKGP